MLKFISYFLLGMFTAASVAQAVEYNQWYIQPQKKRVAAEVGMQAGAKPNQQEKKKKQRVERLRLVNVKDKNHKLIIVCRVNSGHVQINALLGGETDKTAEKSRKTTLSLMIDGESVLKDSKSTYRRAAWGAKAVHANLLGDDTVRFISRFLTAKKTITVSAGNEAAVSYSAANAAQAGLALQNCLHK